VVAVERHHVARLREVQQELELLLVPVSRGVDRRVARRDDVAPDVVQPVDRLVDGALVAGDRGRGEDDGVALVQLDLRVVAVGHAAQSAQRLALAAGRDDDELVVGEVRELAGLDEHAVGHLDVPEHAPDVDVLAHRPADERHLATVGHRSVDHLLDAVDVRGEAGDHDAALAAPEQVRQGRAGDRLAR
jgi:hypothetical protein